MDQNQKNWMVIVAIVLLFAMSNKQSGCTIIKPVDPVVVDPVPAKGPRLVFIFWESGNSTVAMGRLLDDIRSGEAHKYLKEKSHRLEIIDVDQPDPAGNLNPLTTAWKEQLNGATLPVMLVAEKVTHEGTPSMKLLHKESLPVSTVKWTQVIDLVKAHGG